MSKDRKTLPIMTIYELDQLMGQRTMHLSRGAPPFVDIGEDFKIQRNMELRSIVKKEILEGKLPYIVRRPLPNGKYEDWRVADLSLVAVMDLLR
jgi:DNA-directed RNA polymerase I, II, and III subunit RPABC2